MEAQAKLLHVALLGGFEVHSVRGEPVTLPSRNARALLAYLAMSAGRAQSRDKLATLLWGGRSSDKARTSLRQTLSQLRRALNTGTREVIRGDGDAIVLDLSAVTIDVVRFHDLIATGTPEALEDAFGLYHGAFLEGFGPLSEAFETWLMTERMRLHELAESGLTRLLDHYRRADETEGAIRTALRLLALDAFQEPVHRLLMELYFKQGRPRSAIRQYELCRDLLERELGIAPEQETRELAERIRREAPPIPVDREAVPGGGAVAIDQHDEAVSAPGEPRSEPSALTERRFVTLMACGLVDVAALADRLDPEELRTVIVAFEDCCKRAISRHGGHVYALGGQAVAACFGYPRADEHDAERAVRAGFEIVAAMADLAPLQGAGLQARIGVASGEVVVDTRVQEGGRTEATITGRIPHVAAGLQGVAGGGCVLIADSTRRLLGGLFECQERNSQVLDGLGTPIRAWHVVGPHIGQSRFEAIHGAAALTPLIGRDEELELLARRWERAKSGSGQVVVLAGEPGIGKSRLIAAMRERLTAEPHHSISYYCSPHHQQSALYPVIRQLEHAAGIAREDSPVIKLDKLEVMLARATDRASSDAPLIASLLSIPTENRYPPLNLTPQRQKERTLEVLDAQLVGLARKRPTLIVFEDLHWADATTCDAVGHLVDLAQALPVLMIVTHRPGVSIARTGESHVTSLVVKRLMRSESATLVTNVAGHNMLSQEVCAQIIEKADGVPLFIEELTKNALESASCDANPEPNVARRPAVAGIGVPDTLQDLLLARLDRLGPARVAAQEAAVIGRHFSYELLAAVSTLHEVELQVALGRLVAAELVHAYGTPPHANYTFKHALVQEAACASLLRAQLRLLHGRIATVLEERFPEMKAKEPEVLAHHFAGAGMAAEAIVYWQKAGERAIGRCAHREAIAYFDQALALLDSRPQTTERAGQELGLQVLLGQVWVLTAGYSVPEVEAAFSRARELCQQIGDSNRLFFVLLGLWQLYVARQQIARAIETADRLADLARTLRNRDFALEAHVAATVTTHSQGKFDRVLAHANEAIEIYDPQECRGHLLTFGYDARVICLVSAAWALWRLGYPDQALARMHESLTAADQLAHPYSQAMARYCASWLHHERREIEAAREQSEQALAIAGEHGFAFPHVMATMLHGWSLAEVGQVDAGIQQMRDGLAAFERMGHMLWRPHMLAMLAAGSVRAGRTDDAWSLIMQALENAQATGDHECLSELHRLQGELSLQLSAPDAAAAAERCFRCAIDIARRQRAKSFELRAAISLARLWRTEHKCEQAKALLAPLYDWFKEGFDTPDLIEARSLLETLSLRRMASRTSGNRPS